MPRPMPTAVVLHSNLRGKNSPHTLSSSMKSSVSKQCSSICAIALGQYCCNVTTEKPEPALTAGLERRNAFFPTKQDLLYRSETSCKLSFRPRPTYCTFHEWRHYNDLQVHEQWAQQFTERVKTDEDRFLETCSSSSRSSIISSTYCSCSSGSRPCIAPRASSRDLVSFLTLYK